MKNICLILLLLNFYIQGFAQIDTLVFYPLNNPVLKEYSLRKMCVDKSGKLWFATDKGVLCYDGNDVILFEHKDGDSTSLIANSTGRLYLDNNDNLYIFGIPGQQYLNTKTGKVTPLFIRFRDEDKSKIAFPYPFSQPFIDDDASFWIGMYNIGFIHYSHKTKETIYYPLHDSLPFQKNNVYVIQRNKIDENFLWLATDDGIYSFNKTTNQLTRNFRAADPKDSSNLNLVIINMDVGTDTIWFTVPGSGMGCYDIRKGLYTMFPYKNERTGKVSELNIKFFQRKNINEYYISEDEKLPGIFNVKTHKYSFVSNTTENLPAIQLRYFVADSSGNLWSLIFYQLYRAKHNTNKLSTFNLPSGKSTNRLENAFKNAVWDKNNKCYYAVFDSRNEVFVLDSNMKPVKRIAIEPAITEANDEPTTRSQIGTKTNQQIIGKVNEEPNIFDMGLDGSGRLWLCGTSVWFYDKSVKKIIPVKLKPYKNFQEQRFQNLVFRKDFVYLQPSNPACKAIYRINIKELACDSILLPDEIITDNSGINQSDKKMDVLQIDKKGRFAYFCYNKTIFQFDLDTKKARKVVTMRDQEKPFQHFFNMFWYLLDDMDNIWVYSDTIKVYEPKNFRVIKKISMGKDVYPIQLSNINGKNIICVLNSNGLLLLDYKNNRQFKLGLTDGLITVFNSSIACANDMLFIGAIDYLQYISLSAVINSKLARKCYLSGLQVFNQPFKTDSLPEFLHILKLNHNQNFIALTFSSTEFEQPEILEYRYKLEGVNKEWVYANYLDRTIHYNNLSPGNYIFYASIKNADGSWSNEGVKLNINIIPAWWQTDLFKIFCLLIVAATVYLYVIRRVKAVRRKEQLKGKYEKELLELEAKALRSQMNPHFIFNCMNSIKSLIQQKNEDKAIKYLTTFSKLIRTIFQNSDKREITLFEEIETCKLYTQLESMRFGNKFNYHFKVDETIDLKSVQVPALIIQPFIENAIWHGIMPKEDGGTVTISVEKKENNISCTINDDGIGREVSKQNKFKGEPSTHQSKGIHLTQSRLDLDNALNKRNATVEITDKKDVEGKSAGTIAVLTFKEY